MSRIVWLASFPKSGNTWVRFLLANYFSGLGEGGVDVDQLALGRVASSRWIFDAWSMVESSDLTEEESALSRPDVYRAVAAEARGLVFLKTHQAWVLNGDGEPVYPADATAAVVYIVRNPLDVAVSMAAHMNISLTVAVNWLCDDAFTLGTYGDAIASRFPEVVTSWSSHAASWLDRSGLPVVLVRYEDLRADTAAMFARVIGALGAEVDASRIEHAVRFATFERLQQQERERGFAERRSTTELFFRGGRVGDGLRTLSAGDSERLTRRHHAMMQRLGYAAG